MEDDKTVVIPLKKQLLESERRERREKGTRIFGMIAAAVVLLALGFIIGYNVDLFLHPKENTSAGEVIGEIEYFMDNFWLYANDYDDLQEELENRAYYGMTTFAEDPYTTYMSAQEIEEFSSSINMDFVGVGVQFSLFEDIATVKKVFKNSPAEAAGIRTGDIIRKVDGVSISGYDTSQIKEAVLGEKGTEVVITVLRDGKELDIHAIRGDVDSSAYAYLLDDIPVLEIMSFGNSTAKECIAYLNEFVTYDRLIIDMRNNTGGYQSSVEELAGLFIGNNEVYMKQKDVYGNTRTDYTKCSRTYDNFKKIIILVNSDTASAAEVMTICLKETLPYVQVLGMTTHGKGVIQSNHYLRNGGNLKYTSYMWYSPNGVSINGVGIVPDIEVPLPDVMYDYVPGMEEDDSYDVDAVSSCVRFAQRALQYLDYDLYRNDGYFDESLYEAIALFKRDKGIGSDGILDFNTYEAIISALTYESSNNRDKDTQMLRALELMKE